MSETNLTRDKLYKIASDVDLDGRSQMTKDELKEALSEEAEYLLEPFTIVDDLNPGDEVSLNHLSSTLTVTEVRNWDGDEVHITDADGERVEEISGEWPRHTVIVMRTSRGGRHALVANKAATNGPSPWKNDDDPHLRRWRAGDQEWMNNSDDPVFIRRIEEDDDD